MSCPEVFKKKKFKWLVFLLLPLFFFFLFYIAVAFPLIKRTVEIGAQRNINNAINYSISEVSNESLVYNKIIDINYDNDGNVSTIQTNMVAINKISSSLSEKIKNFLNLKQNNSFNIKFGNLTGIALFSGLGPNVSFNIDSIDYVNCEFVSKFSSQGINQTLHSIYININMSCGVVLPFTKIQSEAYQQFLLCESVIVGKIPEVYLFSDNLDSLFNFVPL